MVTAWNSEGESASSNEASAIPATVPSEPQSLSATPGNAQIALAWTAPSSSGGRPILNYTIYRGATSGGETLLRTLGNVLAYTDTSLTNGQTYYYVVRAVNIVGEGPASNEAFATPATVPSAPQNLVASSGNAQVTLTWTAPISDGGSPITNYRIYRGTSSGGETLLATVGNVLTHLDSGLANGQSYYYTLSAVNGVGEGTQSIESSATPMDVPSAPRDLTAAAGNAQITLTWNAPSSDGGSPITNYNIYRGTASGAESLLTTVGNVLTYDDLGLANGQTYYYRLSAVTANGEGLQSGEASATPATIPTAPQGLSASAGNAQIALTWTAPTSDGGGLITNYRLYRGTTSGNEVLLVTIGNILTYTDTGLTNGQTYYYKVSAVNWAGEGAQSNEASATPANVPSAPQSLVATFGDGEISLAWSPPSSDGGSSITGYRVYRGTTSSGETFLTAVANVLTYLDTGLTNGQTYYYRVGAVNALGEGALSNEASATPATLPSAPQSLMATAGNAQISLTWTAPSSDGGRPLANYRVYRGTTPNGEVLLTTIGNVLAYTDTGLTNGLAYYYKVSAVSSIGEGAMSNEATATPASVPGAPSLSSATAGLNRVTLVWTAPGSDGGRTITNYQVFRGLTSGGETLFTTLGNVLTYEDTGLTNGQTYFYQVAAVNSVGAGALSNELSAKPVGPPTAPQNAQVRPGDSFINITWSPPASDGGSPVTNYQIWRGPSSGTETFLVGTGLKLWFNDTGLTNGLTYYYLVIAENSQGSGQGSNEVSATPSKTIIVPTAPQGLVVTPANAQASLTWSAPASDGGSPVTHYSVYRGTAPGVRSILTVLGTVLSYTDTGLTNGQTYYYTVSATNDVGEGPHSSEASATPATIPTAPQSLSASAGNAQIILTWSAPSSNGGAAITAYKVYRGTTSGGETLITTLGNVLTYASTGLTNGQTYYYKVSAVNSVGESPQSNEASATPATTPGAPQGLTAMPGNGQVSLAWSVPSSDGGGTITGYVVHRGTASGGEAPLITLGNVLNFTDTGLTNGQVYYYKVSAFNSVGEGTQSNEASATPVTVPSEPRSLAAMAGNAQIGLTWAAPSSDGGSSIISYLVLRGDAPGSESLLVTLGNVLSYTDTGLSNGQRYYYKVCAVNSIGQGPLSDEVSAVPTTLPSAPGNLVAAASNGQIGLTWTAPMSDGGSPITNYNIYRGEAPGGEVLLVSIGNVLAYADTGLSNGLTYFYRVSAINANGEGLWSDEASATPSSVPSAPLNLTAIPGDSFVNLTWMPPTSDGGSPILNYTIYRGTGTGEEAFLLVISSSLGYIDVGLINGQIYYYKVSAMSATGEGARSDEVSVTPGTVPLGPQNLEARGGDAEVDLTWASPSSDGGSTILGYKVYRGAETENESLLVTLGDVLSYNDTGLTNGQTYYYKVSAWNGFGEGARSFEVSATPATTPSAPRNLTASRGNAEVRLDWLSPIDDGGSIITNYTIYRGVEPGTESLLASIGNALDYTDSGLTNGQTYYYLVRAVNARGEGGWSDEVSATPASLPSAPQNLTAAAGDSQVALNWSAPASDGGSPITNYTIYRGTTPGGEVPLVNVGEILSYVDASLANGQMYYYRVSASSGLGEGPLSEEAYGMPATTPSAPESLIASSGDSQIALSWMPPASDGGVPISSYQIYRGTVPGGETLLTTVGDVLAYVDVGLENDLSYYYRVSAVNSIGEGALSDEASATPSTIPSAPLGLQALGGDRAIDLNWTAPSYVGPGALYYRLSRDGAEMWSGSSTSYRDSQVAKGRLYSYQVAAQNSVGIGASSKAVSGAAFGPPDPPWGLTAVPRDGEVSLSWEEVNYSGPGMLTYSIYRDGWQIWSGNVTSYLDTSVRNGIAYSYQVAASNAIGRSANSSITSAAPQGPPTPPLGLQAKPGPGSVQLNWSAPSYCGPGSIYYILFRDGVLIWSGEEREFEDTGMLENVAHSYTVVAYNSFGEGANSTSVQAVPLSTQSGPPPYWGLVTFLGFVGIAAIPMSMLAYRMYRIRYIRSVSMLPDMRCPSCGTIIPATAAKCPVCKVRFTVRKIVKEKP